MNSLTWTDKVQQIQYADPKELIVKVDIRDFSGTLSRWRSESGTNVWNLVAEDTPTRPREDNDLEFVVDETQTLVPVVNGDWFVERPPSLRSTTRFWSFEYPGRTGVHVG